MSNSIRDYNNSYSNLLNVHNQEVQFPHHISHYQSLLQQSLVQLRNHYSTAATDQQMLQIEYKVYKTKLNHTQHQMVFNIGFERMHKNYEFKKEIIQFIHSWVLFTNVSVQAPYNSDTDQFLGFMM
ncbi:hypothetical protein ACTFIZ_000647 [Dictyostelium cf. discoideum]